MKFRFIEVRFIWWHSGIRLLVCFAACMPANFATLKTEPFAVSGLVFVVLFGEVEEIDWRNALLTFSGKWMVHVAVADLSVGVSDLRLTHSTTGNTNYVTLVKDDMTASPTISNIGTVTESSAGTKRFISGIPYYNSGSPTLQVAGIEIDNLVGQAYTNQSNIVEIDSASGSPISNQDYT